MNQQLETNQAPLNHAPWVKLWMLNWNYNHWLMTSVISTVLASEVYSILLSVYPNFLTTFWFNLGVTSSFIASSLAFFSVLFAGLLSGWLIYSAHLAFYAFKTANHDYQPLIDLWKNYNQNHIDLIDKLFTDEHFLNLSKFLQSQNLPEPIQDFLRNGENLNQINQVMGLLKRIWKIEQLDDKIKALSVNILSEFAKTEHTQEHLDNIWSLCDLLLTNNQFTPENVLKTLENSQQLKAYIPTLSQLSTHGDLLHKLIDEPKLMEYFLAAQEEFQGKDERINQNIDLLYIYMRNQLEQAESFSQFQHSDTTYLTKLNVSPQNYLWVKQYQNPHQLIRLWDNLVHHPDFSWLDNALNFMHGQPEKFQSLIMNFDGAFNLTNLFNRVTTTQSEAFKTLVSFSNSLVEAEDIELFCDALLNLQQCGMLNEQFVTQVFTCEHWKQAVGNLKLYAEKTWSASISPEQTASDLGQLLLQQSSLFVPPIIVPTPDHKPVTPATKKVSQGCLHWFAKRIGCVSSQTSPHIMSDYPVQTPKP